ncbi:MAG TPA: hypothetical protein VG944_16040 [Fimbriimonas sp.]|nr:hypothetical protein [Fimbriimonas sp.]
MFGFGDSRNRGLNYGHERSTGSWNQPGRESGSTRYNWNRLDDGGSRHGSVRGFEGYIQNRDRAERARSDFGRDRSQGRLPRHSEPDYREFRGRLPRHTEPRFGGGHRYEGHGPFGGSWNYRGDRHRLNEFYDRDRNRFDLRVRGGHDYWQSPRWGGHWRYGYSGRGVSFHFGFYLFSPFESPCYVSPWYYDPCLPPYIPAERVIVVPGYHTDWNEGITYDYQPEAEYDSYGDADLNRSIDTLSASFGENGADAIDEITPDFGKVAVYTDGSYDYSLSADDFRSMMLDNAENTETVDFRITNVRRHGGDAIVSATHVVRNQDGGEDTIYEQYRLHGQDAHFVITDIMTSHTPLGDEDGF